jgi:hypothetical protein
MKYIPLLTLLMEKIQIIIFLTIDLLEKMKSTDIKHFILDNQRLKNFINY